MAVTSSPKTTSSTSGGTTKRVSFAKLREPLEVPNLLALQTESFEWLVGAKAWKDRQSEPTPSGLDEILEEISPIEDFSGNLSLSFMDPRFDDVKANEEECRDKDMTYSAPLFVTAEFMNAETGEIKSQTVFMGDFPMMTSKGTFIINGTERVVVSQLVRSPGVYFDRTLDKTAGKEVFAVKVIPSRGAWLEFDIDKRDTIGVRIDRKRRQPVTVLLKALGWDTERIREKFAWSPVLLATLEKDHIAGTDEALLDIYRKLRPGEPPTKESAQALLENLFFKDKRYDLAKVGRYKLNKKLGLNSPTSVGTLTEDDLISTVEYLLRLHDGQESWTIRGQNLPVETDDIDHFGNRRLRTVGELIQNQIRVGLSRMERVVRERMTTQDVEAITPQTLINIRPVVASIKEFFGTSQLSQFMDQTNPLAGLTHKRRLSALGPGGLSRDRASLEVRDVHSSHYGRMCPIETPEGPNIGLIGSLATFARVNPFGFIETPYRKVEAGSVTDEINYLTADEEDRYVIAQANAKLDAVRVTSARLVCSSVVRAARSTRSPPTSGRVHGRLSAPDGVRRHRDDPVPGARRGQPCAHGRQHAASVRPPAAQRIPAGRHGNGSSRRGRRRRRRHRREVGRRRRGDRRLRLGHGRRRERTAPTGCTSSAAPTRAPASTRSRSSTRASGSRPATSSPTAPAPTVARWRWARTCSSPSCRGRVTTTKTRSS